MSDTGSGLRSHVIAIYRCCITLDAYQVSTLLMIMVVSPLPTLVWTVTVARFLCLSPSAHLLLCSADEPTKVVEPTPLD
jgi:hypothetical protein